MKKYMFALLIFLTAPLLSFGQSNENPSKWTVGIIAVGHYQGPFAGYGFQLLPGVQVNRHVRNFELRVGLEHTRYNNVSMPGIYYSWLDGFSNRTLLKAGIERSIFTTTRFRGYVAGDLAFHYTNGEYDRNGCFGPIGTTHSKARGAGFIPSLGAEVKLGSRVSVFAEYRAEFFYTDVQEKTYSSTGSEVFPDRYSSFNYNFGGIGQAGFKFTL